MKLGIGVSEDLSIATQQDVARTVESAGFGSLWTNEARGRDALLLCAAWALATQHLQVGIGVVPIWTRTPVQLAMGSITLQDLSKGRFLLGLGVSHRQTMGPWHNQDYRKPLIAARESLRLLDAVARKETTDFDGEVFSSHRFSIDIDADLPPAPRYLAAMGPRMLALAGTDADGVLLNWSGPGEVTRAAGIVREAAINAGRAADAVDIAAYVRIAVGETRLDAQRALAQQIAAYAKLDAYIDHFGRQGLADTVSRVRALQGTAAATDPDAVLEAVGETALETVGWAGGPGDDPRDAVAAWKAAGLDHFVARVVPTQTDVVADVNRVVNGLAAAIDV